MKKALALVAFVSVVSFADVTVVSAIYNGTSKKIEAQVRFGGCKTPAFKLKFDPACYETFPLQADAEVIQMAGDDGCERLNEKTVAFSLAGDPCGSGEQWVNLKGQRGNSVQVRIQ